MTPWLQDQDLTVWCGDALEVLRGMEDGSVDCVVTSPPYWGLRDYGTGEWEGGDPDCDHKPEPKPMRKFTNGRGEGAERRNVCMVCDYEGPVTSDETERCPKCGSKMADTGYAGSNLTSWTYQDATVKDGGCPKGCGARRVDRQLGLEPTPDQYVARMVEVFREVRRVLAAHGTCWVNLGDSYASAWACDRRNVVGAGSLENGKRDDRPNRLVGGLKEKDLVGSPWRAAFALQADGWWLRSDIIWAKPNPMPESVTDRPTKSHEYVFLLTKGPRYWFDAEAVREPHTGPKFNGRAGISRDDYTGDHRSDGLGATRTPPKMTHRDYNPAGRNVRSVWEIATQPYPEAHFATFPEELARRCIVAGCPEWVCDAIVCGKCGQSHDDIRASHVVAYANDEAVPLPDSVQAELRRVRELLRESEPVHLLAELPEQARRCEPESRGTSEGQLEGRADQSPRLHPPLDADAPGRDEEGLHPGAPLGDGTAPWSPIGAAREGASPERGQGGQSPVEPGGRDSLDAPRGGRVPGLRDALLRSLTCACGATGFRVCGKPRERIVERVPTGFDGSVYGERAVAATGGAKSGGTAASTLGSGNGKLTADHQTLGWSDCGHGETPNYRPGIVLDPFGGSGTVAAVARKHGRRAVLIELNETYCQLIARRTQQQSLLA